MHHCHPSEDWGPGIAPFMFVIEYNQESFVFYQRSLMIQYYVYIMASQRNGTLYTGVTSNLIKRVFEHKSHFTKGFTAKYNVNQLVYFEIHGDILEAIKREKNIKAWKRLWKLRFIEEKNPRWHDLYDQIIGG